MLGRRQDVNGENIKAVGDSTGATYASNDSQDNHLNFNAGGTTNTTATTTFHLISHDQSVPSFTLHALFHLTINPDGTLTAFVNSFTPSCK